MTWAIAERGEGEVSTWPSKDGIVSSTKDVTTETSSNGCSLRRFDGRHGSGARVLDEAEGDGCLRV